MNEVKPFHLAFEQRLNYLKDIKGATKCVASSHANNKWINLLDIEEIYDMTIHIRNFSNKSSYAEIVYKKYGNENPEEFAIYFDTIEDDPDLNERVKKDATQMAADFYETFLNAWKNRGESNGE